MASRPGPALARAQKIGSRCGKVGFDWPGWEGSFDEGRGRGPGGPGGDRASKTPAEVHAEIGDLLLAVVNLARKVGVDAENALVDATTRFTRRFEFVEDRLAERGKTPQQSNLEEMDALWNEAKKPLRGKVMLFCAGAIEWKRSRARSRRDHQPDPTYPQNLVLHVAADECEVTRAYELTLRRHALDSPAPRAG